MMAWLSAIRGGVRAATRGFHRAALLSGPDPPVISMTKEQEALRLRKLKACFAGLDVNKDGYISKEDFEDMAKRFIEYGKLRGEQAEGHRKAFNDIAEILHLEEGVKVSREQYLSGAMEFCPGTEETTAILFSKSFDVVDTDGDGIISPEEFRVYFKCMGINEAHAKASFDGIDTDQDGQISRDEFIAASIEFFYGFDKSSGANLFYGPLVDN